MKKMKEKRRWKVPNCSFKVSFTIQLQQIRRCTHKVEYNRQDKHTQTQTHLIHGYARVLKKLKKIM